MVAGFNFTAVHDWDCKHPRPGGPVNGPYEPHDWSPFGPSRAEETYALQACDSLYIKVGKCSAHTRRQRWNDARRLTGEECEWIGLLDVPEKAAHKWLAVHSVNGEWYWPRSEVMHFIEDHRITE